MIGFILAMLTIQYFAIIILMIMEDAFKTKRDVLVSLIPFYWVYGVANKLRKVFKNLN